MIQNPYRDFKIFKNKDMRSGHELSEEEFLCSGIGLHYHKRLLIKAKHRNTKKRKNKIVTKEMYK